MKKKTSFVILFLITAFGFILRWLNITQYNIYSDSYEFLLLAKNLVERLSLDGSLGKNGMYWGPLFYNRVGWAMFLAPIYALFKNLELSAHILSLAAGILAVPAVYLLTTILFKKREIGLIAALFLAVSFGNVMLSGFIMGNSLVVLFIILSLVCFFKAQENNKLLWYIIAGIILAITCFLRIELLITLPTFLIFIIGKEKFWPKLVSFLVSFVIFSGFLLFIFFRLLSEFSLWWQNQSIYIFKSVGRYGFIVLIFMLVFTLLVFLLKKKKDWFLVKSQKFYSILIILSLLLCFVIPLIARQVYNWSASWFTLKTDFLMIILGFVGLIILFKKDFWKGLFFYLFIYPLLFIYFAFGGGGDFRHINILSPVLIILAALGTWQILISLKGWLKTKEGFSYKFFLTGILLIIGLVFYGQLYQNLRPWHSYISYEKEEGLTLKKIMAEKNIPSDAILISAYPEAHYLYTGLSTWEQRKEKPFIDDSIAGHQKIILLVDEATRDQYPALAILAENKLKPYSLKYILPTVQYQYGSHAWWPKRLATVYYLKAGEIRKIEISDR